MKSKEYFLLIHLAIFIFQHLNKSLFLRFQFAIFLVNVHAQIKSNQIKSNQIKYIYLLLMLMLAVQSDIDIWFDFLAILKGL